MVVTVAAVAALEAKAGAPIDFVGDVAPVTDATAPGAVVNVVDAIDAVAPGL